MKNNKGFATSFILFSLLILFLMLFSVLLFTMNNSISLENKMKNKVIDEIDNDKNVKAIDVSYDNKNTHMACGNVQCTIDYYSRILRRANVFTKGSSYLCKRAKETQLHKEYCSCSYDDNTSENCAADGYLDLTYHEKNGQTVVNSCQGKQVTYGQVGTTGQLNTGDAFICDVDGNGVYDSDSELFYYISDYYDTNTQSIDDKYAVLVYHNNVSAGGSDSISQYAYNSTNQNWNGPITAIEQLPTTRQWSNVSLYKTKRKIIGAQGSSTTSGGALPTEFSYEGYAARLLTFQEIENGCKVGTTSITATGGVANKCKFLFEKTKYTSPNLSTYGSWIETPVSNHANRIYRIRSTNRNIYGNNEANTSTGVGVRPVIEVNKLDIKY